METCSAIGETGPEAHECRAQRVPDAVLRPVELLPTALAVERLASAGSVRAQRKIGSPVGPRGQLGEIL